MGENTKTDVKNNILNNKDLEKAHITIKNLINNIESIIRGRKETILLILTALFADGHILLEDYPGSGKTTLAKVLGYSILNSETSNDNKPKDNQDKTVKFKRIQFTPDMLPTDIIGVNIFDQKERKFRFSQGPVFSNILLADEINRTGPKVQSALLECMAEKQVTVDNITYKLDSLFFVIATQNPIDMAGTYQLPLVQLDRFIMKANLGYITEEKELEVLQDYTSITDLSKVKAVSTKNEITEIQKMIDKVHCKDNIKKTIVSILNRTRNHKLIRLGASTRSGIMFIKALKSYALINGRNYVIEDDIKYIGKYVLSHRIKLSESVEDKIALIQSIIEEELEKLIRQKE